MPEMPPTKSVPSPSKTTVHEKTEEAKSFEKTETRSEPQPTNPPQKKRNKLPIVICLIALCVLVGGFLFFSNNNTQQSRSEQADWQIAVQTNTIAAFQTFIEAHPFGQHLPQAIENIRMLRQQETEAWEAIRETNDIAVLQDFIYRYPENPHIVQAIARIESLTWESNNPPSPIGN